MVQGGRVGVGVRVIRNEFGRENTEAGIHAELSTKTPPRWVYRRDYRVFVNSEQSETDVPRKGREGVGHTKYRYFENGAGIHATGA